MADRRVTMSSSGSGIVSSMRHFCLLLCLACLAALSVPALAGEAPSRQTLVIAADEWCPYNCASGSAEPGFVIEILRAVYEPQGYTVDYQVIPWSRAVADGAKGRFDAVVGATYEEAAGFVFPDEPVGHVANDFFIRRGDVWRYTGVKSLQGVRLGVIRGYEYSGVIDPYLAGQGMPAVQWAHGDEALETNLRKLVSDRLDAVMDERNVVFFTAKKLGLREQIAYAGSDGDYDPIFVAFSPARDDAADLAARFDQGLRAMRADGRLKAILDRYGLDDWRPQP